MTKTSSPDSQSPDKSSSNSAASRSAQKPSRKRLRLRPSIFWSVRRGIPAWLKILMPMIGIGLPILLWSILSYGGFVRDFLLPTPTAVFATGWEMLTEAYEPSEPPNNFLLEAIRLLQSIPSSDLAIDIFASTSRVFGGFALAGLIGITIGLMMGTFHSIEALFNPFVSAVRYMPVAAFVPLIITWAGIDELPKIIIVFMGIVLYNITMIVDAVKALPDEILDAAYTLGSNRFVLAVKVIFPATLPKIINTMRVNVAGAWNFLVLAELLAAEKGLGFRIIRSQRFLNTDKVLFCIIIIGVIGLTTDYALKRLSKALSPWYEANER